MDATPFLRAILADRENVEPRLLYADWLDEQGDLAGYFIREMVQRKTVAFADNLPSYNRQLSQLILHGRGSFRDSWSSRGIKGVRGFAKWVRSWLPPPEKTQPFGAFFKTGMIQEIQCTSEWWLTHGDWLYANHPLKCVRLSTPMCYGPGGNGIILNGLPPSNFRVRLSTSEIDEPTSTPLLLRREWPDVTDWVTR